MYMHVGTNVGRACLLQPQSRQSRKRRKKGEPHHHRLPSPCCSYHLIPFCALITPHKTAVEVCFVRWPFRSFVRSIHVVPLFVVSSRHAFRTHTHHNPLFLLREVSCVHCFPLSCVLCFVLLSCRAPICLSSLSVCLCPRDRQDTPLASLTPTLPDQFSLLLGERGGLRPFQPIPSSLTPPTNPTTPLISPTERECKRLRVVA